MAKKMLCGAFSTLTCNTIKGVAALRNLLSNYLWSVLLFTGNACGGIGIFTGQRNGDGSFVRHLCTWRRSWLSRRNSTNICGFSYYECYSQPHVYLSCYSYDFTLALSANFYLKLLNTIKSIFMFDSNDDCSYTCNLNTFWKF